MVKNTFFVTGNIYNDDGACTSFYVKTKNGSSVTVTKLNTPGSEALWSWTMYQVGNKYVAVSEGLLFSSNSVAAYYVSSDLKSWSKKKLNSSVKSVSGWKYAYIVVASTTNKGIVFQIEHRDGAEWGYKIEYIYTSDFKTYKKLSSLNASFNYGKDDKISYATFCSSTNGGMTTATTNYAVLNNFSVAYDDYGDYTYTGESIEVVRSKGINNYKTALSSSDEWVYYRLYGADDGSATLYIKTPSENYVYIADSSTDSFDKYTTSLSADKIQNIVGSGKWSFSIYDGKYILMTKDHGKTVYKIKTGKKNISDILIQGGNLVLCIDGGYDYYIPISTLKKAVK